MGKKSRNFTRNGTSYQIEADYFNATETVEDDRGRYNEEEVDFTLEYVERYWRLYMDLGFNSFGIANGGITKFEVFFDATKNGNGEADNSRTTIDTKRRRDGNISSYKALLLHELFHACQYALVYPHKEQKAFVEGTANVAAFLCDLDVRRDVGIYEYEGYLNNPGATMWDRPSPGRPKDNRAATTLWWLYFCDQISSVMREPGAKMDAIRDLIASNFTPINPWLTKNHDLAAVGDFLGNGEDQILYHLQHVQYGLVSFNDSFGGNGSRHRITRFGERWGRSSGWLQREEDLIMGKGNITGNGRDQLVITSRNPTHIGVIGYGESDGSPDRGQSLETYAVVGEDGRWESGGWKVRKEDEVAAIGNIMSTSREQIAVFSNNPRYFGVVGIEPDQRLKTYFTILEGSSFGASGWVLHANDKIEGVGDFVGNGRQQLVIQGGDPWSIGIIGFEADGSPKTYAKVQSGQRFGDGWKVRVNDMVEGIGYLVYENRCHMILTNSSPDYLGVVGLTASGETETVKVVSTGGKLGEDWKWKGSHRVVGVGNFIGDSKQQFGIKSYSPNRMGLLGFDNNQEAVTYDYSEIDRSSPLQNVFAIGDFAGLGRDQFYGDRGNYLVNYAYEDPKLDDIGHWRDRFAIDKDTYFYSTHIFLNEYLVSKAGRRLIHFWRDFTVTNVTKDLMGSPATLSYSFGNLPATSVAITANLSNTSTNLPFSVNRWAAAYFNIDTIVGQTSVRLKGEVKEKPFPVFWSIIVEGPAGTYKSMLALEGNTFDQRIDIDSGDVVKLVVTSTYANVDILLSNLG
jgi:hypothetical protein